MQASRNGMVTRVIAVLWDTNYCPRFYCFHEKRNERRKGKVSSYSIEHLIDFIQPMELPRPWIYLSSIMQIYICIYIYVCVCVCVCVCVFLSIYLSIYLSISGPPLSFSLDISLSFFLSLFLSLSIYLSAHIFTHIYLSIYWEWEKDRQTDRQIYKLFKIRCALGAPGSCVSLCLVGVRFKLAVT